MRHISILLMPLLVVGCATQRPVAVQTPPPVLIAAVVPTKVIETPYDVRSYREAANPSVRHEAHAVYRRTVVPLTASEEHVPVVPACPPHTPTQDRDTTAALQGSTPALS